ncbi:hypothetical protein Dda_3184 [Drechslerella dactyloides]|uniref:MARVEL domain-containing protein n=1 Tax=Drechslerella dactyloides TaxID=74499 RepID=A0AAD6NK42_DREDA|nr:hypothetical protein Dda_3184 [Drechslerella dactyloides]
MLAGPIGGAPPVQYTNAAPAAAPPGTMAADSKKLMTTERPAYPEWVRFLPPVILLFTVGVLAMVAYVVHTTDTGQDSLGFNLFACAWGLLVTPFIIVATFTHPRLHYTYLILVLALFSCIWWLTAFAYLASDTKKVMDVIKLIESYASLYGSSSSIFKRAAMALPGHIAMDFAKIDGLLAAAKDGGLVKRASYGSVSGILQEYYKEFQTLKTVSKVMAGAAGLGAIIWILWVVFTVMFIIGLARGSRSSPGVAGTYEPKIEQQQQFQPQYQPTATQLGQPPVYPTMPPPAAMDSSSYAPVKSEGFAPSQPTIIPVDPRAQEQFITPPPPPSQAATPAPGTMYVNPQFGAGQGHGHSETQVPDRGYTVSPLSEISEMPGSVAAQRVEMPGHQPALCNADAPPEADGAEGLQRAGADEARDDPVDVHPAKVPPLPRPAFKFPPAVRIVIMIPADSRRWAIVAWRCGSRRRRESKWDFDVASRFVSRPRFGGVTVYDTTLPLVLIEWGEREFMDDSVERWVWSRGAVVAVSAAISNPLLLPSLLSSAESIVRKPAARSAMMASRGSMSPVILPSAGSANNNARKASLWSLDSVLCATVLRKSSASMTPSSCDGDDIFTRRRVPSATRAATERSVAVREGSRACKWESGTTGGRARRKERTSARASRERPRPTRVAGSGEKMRARRKATAGSTSVGTSSSSPGQLVTLSRVVTIGGPLFEDVRRGEDVEADLRRCSWASGFLRGEFLFATRLAAVSLSDILLHGDGVDRCDK